MCPQYFNPTSPLPNFTSTENDTLMNHYRLSLSMLSLAAIAALGLSANAADKKVDCTKEIKVVKAEIAKDASKVLKIVADEVAASPNCACEIVKTAIVEAKLTEDKVMVVQIVKAAAEAAPEQIANIISCAQSAAPDAQVEIANIFSAESEGSGKGVVSGKETAPSGKGKVPVPPTPVDEENIDFGLMRPGVGGVYFSNPGGGNGGVATPRPPDDNTDDDPTPRPNRPPGGVSPTSNS